MPKQTGTKQIASNRKAFHDYFVLDRFEAGIELEGLLLHDKKRRAVCQIAAYKPV